MTRLEFQKMIDADPDEADRISQQMHQEWLDSTCGCENPDDQYLLSIDCGQMDLVHAACRKAPRWGDSWEDCVFSNEVLVKVTVDNRCDCNPYITLGHECGPEFNIEFPEGS